MATETDAENLVLYIFSTPRYDTDDYLNIKDWWLVMPMHRFNTMLVGKNLESFVDASGTNQFTDIVSIAIGNGGGFGDWLQKKPGGEISVAATNCALCIEPCDWILVTGIYMDDVQRAFFAKNCGMILDHCRTRGNVDHCHDACGSSLCENALIA